MEHQTTVIFGMNTRRPVYISLTQFRWPLAAISSIAHRITGVLLFVGVGFLLYLLDLALTSAAGFAEARALVESPLGKLVIWAVLASLAFHFVAGIKHMLMDFHVAVSLGGGKLASQLTFVLSAVLMVLAGIWLW